MRANDKTRAIAVEAKRDFPAAEVEIIGAWVWLTFDGKPSQSVRDDLKGRGFRIWRRRK
jgi:hypothetical protein